jgi:hypothetical protein
MGTEIGKWVDVWAQANSFQDPVSEVIRAKWAGGVAQAESQLWLCKHEALSSNLSPTKKKKKERKYYIHNVLVSFCHISSGL